MKSIEIGLQLKLGLDRATVLHAGHKLVKWVLYWQQFIHIEARANEEQTKKREFAFRRSPVRAYARLVECFPLRHRTQAINRCVVTPQQSRRGTSAVGTGRVKRAASAPRPPSESWHGKRCF